jgi:hypothetical protein
MWCEVGWCALNWSEVGWCVVGGRVGGGVVLGGGVVGVGGGLGLGNETTNQKCNRSLAALGLRGHTAVFGTIRIVVEVVKVENSPMI